MSSKPSIVKCPKCGSQPNIITDTCMNCGSKLEKICGECGASVVVEKNYCDKCGSVLALQPPPRPEAPEPPPPPAPEKRGFSLEMESIQDTVSERATSFRRKITEPPPASAAPAPAPSKPAAPAREPKGGGSVLSPDSARLMKEAPLPKPVKQP
ncbi:MAG: zinc ribbon domain-containing protein, partial [Elusimicrobia bacterium]|nr:zinc ribbon domain-containing protein [Elusimicrobiota bacterium]